MTIDYLQPPLGYLLRLPCSDDAADSPLDEPARDRAEQAAAFLRYERIGQIFCAGSTAARETAEIVWLACSWDFTDSVNASGLEGFLKFLLSEDRGLPCVLAATNADVQAAMKSLGISLDKHPGDADAFANVRNELVAPGGVISLHRDEEKIVPRARHMIIDFSFTDLEKAVAWKELSTK